MISKAQIKNIRLLHQKKYRDKLGLFIAEGPKVVRELMSSGFRMKEIYCLVEFNPVPFEFQEVTQEELQRISTLTTANQVLAIVEVPRINLDADSMKKELILALDDIRDPGNMGTIIRIADWFGIHHILCSESSVEIFNPKVIQSTMGSIARVNVYRVDLDKVLKSFDPVYAAVLDGKSIYKEKLSDRGVILIGNESQGISEKLMKYVSTRIAIPNRGGLHSQAQAESLNAAVATAIICSEFRRR